MNNDNDNYSENAEAFTNEAYKSKYLATQNYRDDDEEQYGEQNFKASNRGLDKKNYEAGNNRLFFQSQIHNTGFWGDVTRRRGTWLAGIGAVLFSIAIVMIGVFWRWWYGPEVNVPCRIVAITLLIVGMISIIAGLISNALMDNNRESKHFLGSPPRWSSWLLLCGILFIIIAADFITFYYSYWHNRFINTPFIISSIILFFFGTIFAIVGLRNNIKEMQKQYKLVNREMK